MKIAFFTNTYLPINYGSVTSVENFRHGLEKLRHEVWVFAPKFKGYIESGENIFRTPSLMYGYKIKYPLAIPFWRGMYRKIDQIKPDIIHCHHPFSIGQGAMSYAQKKNIPVVFTHHCKYEEYVHYVPPFLPRSLIALYSKKIATDFANKSDYVIAPSGSIKEVLKSRGVVSPIKVLPTGIEWARFQKADRSKMRKKFAIAEDDIVLVSNGRIDEEKNIMFLVRSLFPLLGQNKKIKLFFVGDGSLKESVFQIAKKENLQNQVFLTGFIPQKNIQDYYVFGDIFVQASLTETQGMSLLEALASGLAVVAINASGSVDQIENQKTGLLVDNNEEVFKKAVLGLVENKEKRLALGEAAREYGKECDSSSRARELEDVYRKVLLSHGKKF